jgi:hypothetical protein
LEGGLASGLERFRKEWSSFGLEELGDKKRNRGCGERLIHEFFNFLWSPSCPYRVNRPPKTHKVGQDISGWEVPFAIDIGLPIPLVGRADGLAVHKGTGELWLIEYKTTSELEGRFPLSFSRSSQLHGYVVGAREVLGLDIKGVIVQGLLVSHVGPKFHNFLVFSPPSLQQEWIAWAKEIGEMVLAREAGGNWTKWLSGCNQIGMFGLPGYGCEYEPLCAVGGEAGAEGGVREVFMEDRHVPLEGLV